MKIFSDDLPQKAKIFVLLVTLLGITCLGYSLSEVLRGENLTWLLPAGLTILGSVFPVRIPVFKARSHSLTVTVSDIFILTSILLFSPQVAVVIALIDGLLASIKVKKLYRIVFNVSQMCLVTFVAGTVFYGLQGQQPPLLSGDIDNVYLLFVNSVICTLLHYGLNSGIVALAIALATQNRPLDVWRQHFQWVSSTHLAAGSAAILILLAFEQAQFFTLVMVLPVMAALYQVFRHRREALSRVPQEG